MKGQYIKLGKFNSRLSREFEVLCDEAGFTNEKIAELCSVSIENVKAWKNVKELIAPDWDHLLKLSKVTDMNFAARYARVIDQG